MVTSKKLRFCRVLRFPAAVVKSCQCTWSLRCQPSPEHSKSLNGNPCISNCMRFFLIDCAVILRKKVSDFFPRDSRRSCSPLKCMGFPTCNMHRCEPRLRWFDNPASNKPWHFCLLWTSFLLPPICNVQLLFFHIFSSFSFEWILLNI